MTGNVSLAEAAEQIIHQSFNWVDEEEPRPFEEVYAGHMVHTPLFCRVKLPGYELEYRKEKPVEGFVVVEWTPFTDESGTYPEDSWSASLLNKWLERLAQVTGSDSGAETVSALSALITGKMVELGASVG
jgi:hypothetical protein